MKWIKPYLIFNESTKWYEYQDNGKSAAHNLIRAFNILFNPLGFNLSLNKIQDKDILLSFRIDINFALQDTSNKVFKPILDSIDDKVDIEYAYPNFGNGRYTTYTVIDLYHEYAKLGNIFDREQNGGAEVRKFKKHLLSTYTTEEDMLAYVIYCVNELFRGMSTVVSYADQIILPKRVELPLFRNVVREYCKFLLNNSSALDVTEPPKELYEFVFAEIGDYPDHFKLLKKLKDTPLYAKLKSVGNIDTFATGEQMGELGF